MNYFYFHNFTCAANVPKKTSSSDASFKKVRDPQTGGEGTFVMFLAERRALVVMEADMVKVYEKNFSLDFFNSNGASSECLSHGF